MKTHRFIFGLPPFAPLARAVLAFALLGFSFTPAFILPSATAAGFLVAKINSGGGVAIPEVGQHAGLAIHLVPLDRGIQFSDPVPNFAQRDLEPRGHALIAAEEVATFGFRDSLRGHEGQHALAPGEEGAAAIVKRGAVQVRERSLFREGFDVGLREVMAKGFRIHAVNRNRFRFSSQGLFSTK